MEPNKQCWWRWKDLMGKRRKKIKDQCLGCGPGEDFSENQSPCGLGLGNADQLPKEDLAGAGWVFWAPEASAV